MEVKSINLPVLTEQVQPANSAKQIQPYAVSRGLIGLSIAYFRIDPKCGRAGGGIPPRRPVFLRWERTATFPAGTVSQTPPASCDLAALIVTCEQPRTRLHHGMFSHTGRLAQTSVWKLTSDATEPLHPISPLQPEALACQGAKV